MSNFGLGGVNAGEFVEISPKLDRSCNGVDVSELVLPFFRNKYMIRTKIFFRDPSATCEKFTD